MDEKSIKVSKDTLEKLFKIQGILLLQGEKKSISEVIGEMCDKWDSLIKSYEALNSSSLENVER